MNYNRLSKLAVKLAAEPQVRTAVTTVAADVAATALPVVVAAAPVALACYGAYKLVEYLVDN